MVERRVDGPTPNGGAYTVITYYDIEHKRVDEEVATHAELVEFDANGEQVLRTYVELEPVRRGQ